MIIFIILVFILMPIFYFGKVLFTKAYKWADRFSEFIITNFTTTMKNQFKAGDKVYYISNKHSYLCEGIIKSVRTEILSRKGYKDQINIEYEINYFTSKCDIEKVTGYFAFKTEEEGRIELARVLKEQKKRSLYRLVEIRKMIKRNKLEGKNEVYNFKRS